MKNIRKMLALTKAGIIESLQADGYTIVPISELLLPGDCTIDSTGCQVPS